MPRLNRRVTFNLQKLKMAQDIEMQPLDKPPSGYQFLYSGFYYGQVTAAKNESRFVWVNANKKRPARGEVSGFARILRYLCCMTFADMEMDTMDSPSVPKMQYKITVEIFTSKMQQLIYEIELLYANGPKGALQLSQLPLKRKSPLHVIRLKDLIEVLTGYPDGCSKIIVPRDWQIMRFTYDGHESFPVDSIDSFLKVVERHDACIDVEEISRLLCFA